MTDSKKNIGPEAKTPAKAPTSEQSIPNKPESIVRDSSLTEPTAPGAPQYSCA